MVNTPLQLAEALARFINAEAIDRDLLTHAIIDPDLNEHAAGWNAERGRPEVSLLLYGERGAQRAREIAAVHGLIDRPLPHPDAAPWQVHHRMRGTWDGIRIEVTYIEHLPVEPATDPGDDLAALDDEAGEDA